MSESFQPENSGATPDKPSDSEPVPLDKTRDALRRLPRESLERIYHHAKVGRRFRHLSRKTIYSPEDLVHEAVKRLFDGTRHWYPKNDLVKTIIDTAESLAYQYYHEAVKGGPENGQQGGNETTAPSPTAGETERSGDEATEPASLGGETESCEEDESAPGKPRRATEGQGPADQPFDSLTPERVIQREGKSAKLREEIFRLLEGDPLAIRFISYGLEHPDVKPREVAPALGITIEDFRNLQKRLRRKLGAIKALLQEFAEDPEPQPNPRTLNFPKEV